MESKPTASKTTEVKKPLHECFPFTIGPEQPSHSHTQPQPVAPTPTMTDPKTTAKFSPQSRRFSMGEALSLSRLHSTGSSSLTRSRRARSSLCSDDTSDQTPTITEHSDPSHKRTRSSSRSRSLLRLPLTLIRGLSNSRKREAQPQLIPNGQATPTKPLEEFRGGQTWSRLSTDRENLGLDLFWPIPLPHAPNNPHSHSHSHSHPLKEETNGMGGEGEEDPLSLPTIELAPLTHFRNLRSLKLVGMMNPYQPTIWQTAWLNPHLEDLELGMALPPSLRRPYVSQWPVIRGGWKLSMGKYEEPVY
ncbi:uncharacterized protein BDW43DRAFT_267041 [Aspergillus alliaceus]|uniref:uncharacterized protein n=1 Tax=Petromyces alliaceus TaxID=209559 RepID=UPI0012A732B7|nr:uncharacterized protein BDW43DRAFT_267041 [Aspergillus alliaceus]KAB8236478.1 hypothetical protein BDW43DRAFT_267041 [Aspergillus alliaceus]